MREFSAFLLHAVEVGRPIHFGPKWFDISVAQVIAVNENKIRLGWPGGLGGSGIIVEDKTQHQYQRTEPG